ncbi:MAG: hypothetical protein Q9228_004484 [Teloschistes exilis]
MAPLTLSCPSIEINPLPLTQSTFAPFGTAVSSPLPSSMNTFPTHPSKTPNIIPANQNTALKCLNASPMVNKYASGPSKVKEEAVTNMFCCFPRSLRRQRNTRTAGRGDGTSFFDVRILERHPYTTQTFIPLGVPPEQKTKYLVIVAPTLLPPSNPPSKLYKEIGLPDLRNLKAFWAHGGQAVTYGAGTWHAPMVVIGDARIDFLVVQWANGVQEEDCQEVDLEEGVSVVVDEGTQVPTWPRHQSSQDGIVQQSSDGSQSAAALAHYKNYLTFPDETRSLTSSGSIPLPKGEEIVVLHGYLGSTASLAKKLLFVQLIGKDRTRSIQIVSSAKTLKDGDASAHETIKKLPMHTPVVVRGLLRERKQRPEQDSSEIEKIKHVEVDLLSIQPLNEFPSDIIATPDTLFGPEQRHLQLRSEAELRKALSFRSKVGLTLRSKLDHLGFVDIETPLLFKSTPEGAREFIVPTRRKGFAYALPQSPQQFKQILMGSGIPKYYQFARCFRDEDLRADRQPEFTQLDLEMSFAGAEQVMPIIEDLVRSIWLQHLNVRLPEEFPRMSYEKAMSEYGSDKPDTRLNTILSRLDYLLPGDLTAKITSLQCPIIEAFVLRFDSNPSNDPHITRNFIGSFLDSPDGTPFMANPDGGPGVFVIDSQKPLQGLQALGFEAAERIEDMYRIEDGDLLIVQARVNRPFSGGSTALGNLRLALHAAAVRQGFIKPPIGFAPLWITDFPLFSPTLDSEPGQGGSAGLAATHHPFTSPKTARDVDMLLLDPSKVIGDHYDLVINGIEMGGGSRRIHNAELQALIMRDVLKMRAERLADFSHLLEVLRAGCPPHAGIALGFDRLIALMLGKSSVRDVIAFPKTGKGEDPLVKSPGPLSEATLKTYHLQKSLSAESLAES